LTFELEGYIITLFSVICEAVREQFVADFS